MNDAIILTVDNVYTSLSNISKDIELLIWTKLSYEIKEFGVEYTKIRHLYNRKTKMLYTGLVEYVIEIFTENDIKYEIIDKRKKYEKNANFNLVKKIKIDENKSVDLVSRQYQTDIVNRASEREVIQAATGAGKTFIMASLIAKFNVKPVSVFADKLTLCTQIKEEFEKFLGVKVGLIGGGISQKEDITVYSIQSATQEDVKDSKMILFDECLDYDQLVILEDYSYEKIGYIVENKIDKKVLSFNHENNKLEFKKILNYDVIKLNNNNKKLMKITIKKDNGDFEEIVCTDNHKIWSNDLNCYVLAKDLLLGQKIKALKGE